MDLGHLPVAHVIDEGDFLTEELEVAELAIDEYPQRVAGAPRRVSTLAQRRCGEQAEQETGCYRKARPRQTSERTSPIVCRNRCASWVNLELELPGEPPLH
jgi:hypothetical protein